MCVNLSHLSLTSKRQCSHVTYFSLLVIKTRTNSHDLYLYLLLDDLHSIYFYFVCVFIYFFFWRMNNKKQKQKKENTKKSLDGGDFFLPLNGVVS